MLHLWLLAGLENLLSAKILHGLAHNWVCPLLFSFCMRRCPGIGFGVSERFMALHISLSKGKSCCLSSSVLTSLFSDDLSRSGGWLGRLLYGLASPWSSLYAPPSSFTICVLGKIRGKNLPAVPCCACFVPTGVTFSFFFPLMMAKSHWPAHDMLLSSGRGGKSGMSC